MSQEQTKPATPSTAQPQTTAGLPPDNATVGALVRYTRRPVAEQPLAALSAVQQLPELQALCQHLRATHRCPGVCVLSVARQDRLLREMETRDVLGNSGPDEDHRRT